MDSRWGTEEGVGNEAVVLWEREPCAGVSGTQGCRVCVCAVTGQGNECGRECGVDEKI